MLVFFFLTESLHFKGKFYKFFRCKYSMFLLEGLKLEASYNIHADVNILCMVRVHALSKATFISLVYLQKLNQDCCVEL